VVFLALLISSFVVGGSPPDGDDSTNKVVLFGYLSLLIGVIFLTPAFAVAFPSFGIWIALLSMLMLPTRKRGS
jgi:hypothetical protein